MGADAVKASPCEGQIGARAVCCAAWDLGNLTERELRALYLMFKLQTPPANEGAPYSGMAMGCLIGNAYEEKQGGFSPTKMLKARFFQPRGFHTIFTFL